MKTKLKYKTIKIQFFSLFIIIILYIFLWAKLQFQFSQYLFGAALAYWVFLDVIVVLFSYYMQKRINLVGIKKQKELKQQIGLYKHQVSFAEYLKFTYRNRLKPKNKISAIKGATEQYRRVTILKEIMIIAGFTALYVLIIFKRVSNAYTAAALSVAGALILPFIMDFIILRARYEEGIFIKTNTEETFREDTL